MRKMIQSVQSAIQSVMKSVTRCMAQIMARKKKRDTEPDDGSSSRSIWMRLLFYASAIAAAGVSAALLANFVVMPILVRQGDLVQAPELIGRSIIEARNTAEGEGLKVRIDTERPDALLPPGHVLKQVPTSGVEIKRGRTIAVVLSSGFDVRAVPRLNGLPARQAQLEAEHAGLAVADLIEVHTALVPRGLVIGTDPGAGSVVPVGTGVRILVSLGPTPIELAMPGLIGKTPEEARVIAEGLGLVVRSTTYEQRRGRGSRQRDVVIVQDPAPGARVTEGESVVIRIGRG